MCRAIPTYRFSYFDLYHIFKNTTQISTTFQKILQSRWYILGRVDVNWEHFYRRNEFSTRGSYSRKMHIGNKKLSNSNGNIHCLLTLVCSPILVIPLERAVAVSASYLVLPPSYSPGKPSKLSSKKVTTTAKIDRRRNSHHLCESLHYSVGWFIRFSV